MSLPNSDEAKLVRLALLLPERIDMAHPLAPSHQVIGWSILKDECWSKGDGLEMLTAIERQAGIRWPQLRRGYHKLIGGRP